MKTIKRMIEHQMWANRQLLAAIDDCEGDVQEALNLFRHYMIAEQVWGMRMNGESTAHIQLWIEDADLASLGQLIASNEARYRELMESLTEERLDSVLSYANQSGAEFQTPIRDILAHVSLHGQYHRGQINRIMREASGKPGAVDFILFSRLSE
ncbi:DinB family protein [Paenibacillus sp. MMS18-CY102]|uniref:DinB family protein n=1 Tax=Paenibacillus sp. MMS18-CY102 TaxID=2682849 RepID=UPI00136547FB|nr:DinB family protein [Paenibacillus sp. MMS18-CY102]MWC29870.1 damage-inducible protein DinB [Paenibacillus sp. MMS18-CY102]